MLLIERVGFARCVFQTRIFVGLWSTWCSGLHQNLQSSRFTAHFDQQQLPIGFRPNTFGDLGEGRAHW